MSVHSEMVVRYELCCSVLNHRMGHRSSPDVVNFFFPNQLVCGIVPLLVIHRGFLLDRALIFRSSYDGFWRFRLLSVSEFNSYLPR
jgi:hypothetical protein